MEHGMLLTTTFRGMSTIGPIIGIFVTLPARVVQVVQIPANLDPLFQYIQRKKNIPQELIQIQVRSFIATHYMMTRSIFILSIWTSVVTAFTVNAPLTMKSRPLLASSVATRFKLSSFFSSSSQDSTTGQQQDMIIRELEKKQAALERRREEAMKQLSQYEADIERLQSKKKEYMASSQLAKLPTGGSFSETALRSAVKAFCWRILAGSITFVTTLRFSGSYSVAFQVVGADFFSKAFTMFIGERLMNKSQAGRKTGSDAAGRSLAKALIWRLFAIANTMTMAIFVAKDLSIASKIASTDAVFKTALMFFYERFWARVQWGKEYFIEFSI